MPGESDISSLEKILYSQKIDAKYAKLASNTDYQDNSVSSEELVKNLNNSLTQINYVHNQLNLLSNNKQEILLKKDQLIQFENDELNNQINKLESIQGIIINKDRLIEEININIDNQNINIKILIFTLVLAIILLIVVYLYVTKKLDFNKTIKIISILAFIFIIIIIYAYNIFYFRDAITYLFDRRALRLGNALQNWNISIKENAQTKLYGSESDWISNNCTCSATETTTPVYANDANTSQTEIPGYFYYDGTAPQQLLVPLPTEEGNYNQNINWVDYSQDGSTKYNPKTQKTTYENKNFYNYNAPNDPTVMLMKQMDNSHSLVYEETYTANL